MNNHFVFIYLLHSCNSSVNFEETYSQKLFCCGPCGTFSDNALFMNHYALSFVLFSSSFQCIIYQDCEQFEDESECFSNLFYF